MPTLFSSPLRHCPPTPLLPALALTLSNFLSAPILEGQGKNQSQAQGVSISVSTDESGAVATSVAGGPGARYHPSRSLVRFQRGAPSTFLPGSGTAHAFPGDASLYLVQNPPGLSVAETVRRYKSNPNVLYAEPDYLVQAFVTPTDPLWSSQWDMTKISCPAAWDQPTDGTDVVVAVIDTGIDYTHPDLQPNLWTNPPDSAHGYTCIGNGSTPGTCVPGGSDDYGHGTHCAGTIGAAANNGIGIAGINWDVKLLSLKFLGSNGSGWISDAISCFNKVTELKGQGWNIRVTSNSWGGGGFSQALKDAMANAGAAGVVNVCAAGNSGQNADVSPMYPAGYDNRDIVSVLASDINDIGASFTNYGLFNVDIAAPGVSTLSTVPLCTSPPAPPIALCHSSGYKTLSGTSMATPHVSGVLAALFQKHPELSTYEARDLVLLPESYDALSDPKAQSTSTGGRLNFAKALGNSPPAELNGFPTLTMGPNIFASAGSSVNLTAIATDPENDPLRMAWAKSGSTSSQWLFGSMLNSLFPNPSGSSVSFTAPSLARTAMVSYDASVADGRGGGAHDRDYVTVLPAPNPGGPPSGALTVIPTVVQANTSAQIAVSFPVIDPEGLPTMWDFWIGQKSGASGACCYSGPSTTVTLNPGVFRFSTTPIDRELNLGQRPSVVVKIGDPIPAGEPPIAMATLDKLSCPAPCTVAVDMSASSDPDGTIQWYFMNCGVSGFAAGSQSPIGSCSYTTPGTYWMILQVQDNSGSMDVVSTYAIVTPPPGGSDTTPPTVTITSPTNGATVSGNVSITANASDNFTVSKVDFYREGANPIGTDTSAPYAITWDSTTALPGLHTLYAIATDGAGNTATSASVEVTVSGPDAPQVTITSPLNGADVPRRSTVTIEASVTPGSDPVSHVDFLVNSNVVCTDTTPDTTGLYSCDWQVPAKPNKSHVLRATVYDTRGQSGVSSDVTVTAR
jgi:subtilisin family serine protease